MLGAYYALATHRRPIGTAFLSLWGASVVVTLVYLLVGYLKDAPEDAIIQIPIIYIATPILWAFALHGALLRYGVERIVQVLLLATVLAILSQAFYFWAFARLGPQALEFMGGMENVDFRDNSVAAVMHVFGSMAFLYGGLLASPQVVRNVIFRYGLLVLAFASTFTSGRGMLIVSLAIGVFLNLTFSLISRARGSGKGVVNIMLSGLALVIASALLANLYDIDISVSVDAVLEKITSGGGAQRRDYLPFLFYGSLDHYFMGAGHGIGVQYVASEEFPWRYEMVWLATLYRVGIVGSIIYALPFCIAIWKSLSYWRAGLLSNEEKYLCGALVSAFVAGNTNPYIEAYPFQWMYVLPCLYFMGLRRANRERRSRPESALSAQTRHVSARG